MKTERVELCGGPLDGDILEAIPGTRCIHLPWAADDLISYYYVDQYEDSLSDPLPSYRVLSYTRTTRTHKGNTVYEETRK